MKVILTIATLLALLGAVAFVVYWNSEVGRIGRFWFWFTSNHSVYEQDPGQINESNISAFRNHLHLISDDLTFQMGKARDGDGYELEISADGYIATFPLVEQVVARAPHVPHWNIIAFRQPNLAIIKMGDVEVDPELIKYFSVKNKTTGKIDVIVYYANFQYENEQWQQALFVTLDNTLGEYDFATKVGEINFMNTSDADDRIRDTLKPISELKDELGHMGSDTVK
jgi:hypothetical protein